MLFAWEPGANIVFVGFCNKTVTPRSEYSQEILKSIRGVSEERSPHSTRPNSIIWIAVKELNLSCSIGETVFKSIYTH